MSRGGTRRRSRRALIQSVGDAFARPAAAVPPSGYYLKVGRSAMACQFEVFLRPQDRAHVGAVQDALDEIDRLEAQMTVYRDDSEVSRLNRAAAGGPQPVESRLYDLLRLARGLGASTGGAFDLTAGPLIRCWGFSRREGRVPDDESLQRALGVTGWDRVAFDDERRSVRFLAEGVELNLGSIGKGYALDRAAERLREAGLESFLIHAGHSSIYAAGDSSSGPGWEVAIRDPHAGERSLGSVRLRDRGMSTSGVGEQFFVAEGRRYGHILDPRTGRPAEENVLVTVVAPSAAVAEALSTAFFVMSADEVRRYCEARPEVGTLLVAATPVDPDGRTASHVPRCLGISLEPAEIKA